jgi:predicted nucleotidyltransferase
MTDLESLLSRSAHVLREAGAPFALVGGLGVSVRSEPRFTKDIDLAVAVADAREAEKIVAAFLAQGYRVTHQVEQEATGRLATVRLSAPGTSREGPVLDLLFASSGIEPEIVASAEPLAVFPSLVVPVATRAHLLATKVLARDDGTRPQDRVDAIALLRHAEAGELDATRDALERIRDRGFHRERDLQAALRGLEEEAGRATPPPSP